MRHLEYYESRKHITDELPLAYYIASKDAVYPPQILHCHREFELGRILSGTISYYIGGTLYHLEEGDCYFVQPEILHGCQKQNCEFESVVFDLDAIINANNMKINENIQKITRHARIPSYYPKENVVVCQIFETVISYCRTGIYDHILSIIGNLLLFFGWIDEHNLYKTKTNEILPTQEMRLRQVLNYIEENYASPITLSDMANCIGMSPCYFTSFFTTILHRSPINYLNYYRIEKACFLLINSNHSITDIAFQTGFNSSSYFVKIFKLYKGITPKQYRSVGTKAE